MTHTKRFGTIRFGFARAKWNIPLNTWLEACACVCVHDIYERMSTTFTARLCRERRQIHMYTCTHTRRMRLFLTEQLNSCYFGKNTSTNVLITVVGVLLLLLLVSSVAAVCTFFCVVLHSAAGWLNGYHLEFTSGYNQSSDIFAPEDFVYFVCLKVGRFAKHCQYSTEPWTKQTWKT